MATVSITILDKRHKGHGVFTHYVEPSTPTLKEHIEEFIAWRKWCWETWGAGVERDFFRYSPDALWAWHSDNEVRNYRIYFKGAKELNWFKIRWMN